MHTFSVILVKGLLEGPTYYASRYVDYMEINGIPYYVMDVDDPPTYNTEEFNDFAKRPGVIMFTFNSIGIELKDAQGNNFWKANDIPVFEQIVDHPRYYGNLLKDPPCDLFVFTLDRNHVEFIQKYYPKVKGVFFSPNGGWEIDSSIPYRDREIDVIYMGDCQESIDSYPVIELFEDGGRDFFQQVIGNMIASPMMSVEEAIDKYIYDHSLKLDSNTIFELNRNYGYYLETPVKHYFKLEGMSALDRMGVHVEIFGNGWVSSDYPLSDNIRINGRIKRDDLMSRIGRAKISLCFMPWFKRGCSEKNLDSMLNGAICVTDRSEYLMEHYKDGYNIVYFDLNDPSQMAADIKWLLDNPSAAEQIASRGYETAKKYDTWFVRYDRITEVIRDVMQTRS